MGFDQGFVITTVFAATSSVGGLSLATVGPELAVPTLPTQTQLITEGGEGNVPTLPTQTQLITEGGEDGPPTLPSPATPVTVV